MPYIKQSERDFILGIQGIDSFVTWLRSVPVEQRKGFIAFIVEYLALYSFEQNYFGRSTGLDAVRSAFNELKKDLQDYENKKRIENGDV